MHGSHLFVHDGSSVYDGELVSSVPTSCRYREPDESCIFYAQSVDARAVSEDPTVLNQKHGTVSWISPRNTADEHRDKLISCIRYGIEGRPVPEGVYSRESVGYLV